MTIHHHRFALAFLGLASALLAWGCSGTSIDPDPSTCGQAGGSCRFEAGLDSCCAGSLCLTAAGAAAPRCCLLPGGACTDDSECCHACVSGVCMAAGCDPGVGAAAGMTCSNDAECASCVCDTSVAMTCVGD